MNKDSGTTSYNIEELTHLSESDLNNMIKFISKNSGVHPTFVKMIVATIVKKDGLIMDSTEELCKLFDVDVETGINIAKMSLDKFNPDKVGTSKVSG